MKLDLDYLHKVSDNLHQLYREAGDYNPDEHVYNVQFSPECNDIRCHISWPYFRNLIANEADAPCEMSRVEEALHLRARVHGVEMVCCVFRHEVVSMLKELVAEHPEGDYEVCEDDDIVAMFIIWQNMTGWDLDWPEEVVVYD